jgi:hypothetical protein
MLVHSRCRMVPISVDDSNSRQEEGPRRHGIDCTSFEDREKAYSLGAETRARTILAVAARYTVECPLLRELLAVRRRKTAIDRQGKPIQETATASLRRSMVQFNRCRFTVSGIDSRA